MAQLTDEKIRAWIDSNSRYGYGYGYGYGSGDGSGSGYGYGSGDGSGSGSGDGYGSGSGDGYGYGYGYGYGSGDGLKSLNGFSIFYIDNLPTIFYRICGNLARGAIVDSNTFELTLTVIVKGDGYFAHGATAKEASAALQAKIIQNMSVKERIEMFVKEHKPGVKYKGTDYYEWHHTLTGSCKFGRDNFVKQHNIDLEAEYTPQEFIDIVKNAYGSEIIASLAKAYKSCK